MCVCVYTLSCVCIHYIGICACQYYSAYYSRKHECIHLYRCVGEFL